MKNFFLPILFTAIVLGILFPGGEVLKPALPFLLGLLLFFNFYTIEIHWKHFLRKEILIYLVIVLGIMPPLVAVGTKFLPPAFQLGIFLAAISPAAVSGSVMVGIIGGSLELSIANTVISNLISPFSYTLLTGLYFDTGTFEVSSTQIIVKLMLLVGIPFGLSMLLKRVSRVTPLLKRVSSHARFLFILIVFMAISSSSKQLRTIPLQELAGVILSVVSVASVLYALGLLLGRDAPAKRALAVNMGQKNNSLCIWLALSNFGPLVAIPATIYIIVQHLLNTLLIFRLTRHSSAQG